VSACHLRPPQCDCPVMLPHGAVVSKGPALR
jgi:hypothetical protein